MLYKVESKLVIWVTMTSSDSTFYDIQCSLEVAIESILSHEEKIDIPINGMIIFHGDCMHAGASNRTINHRIFASCSNNPLENENVFVAESEFN